MDAPSEFPPGSVPVYFELSWSILSSIGIFSLGLSLLVIAATELSPLAAVAPVVSVAGAVANGLCYFAFYTTYNIESRLVASAFADFLWLIQEAGLSFYSFQILVRALEDRKKTIFLVVFWSLMTIISGIRITIMISRIQDLLHSSDVLQNRVDHLHMGYFISIALVETCSSGFLINLLHQACLASKSVENLSTKGIFRHLLRTTEMRLATLALIGIGRAITYSSQTTSQSATTVASQCDRFMYTLECLFPFIMLIDILASKACLQPDRTYQTHRPSHLRRGSSMLSLGRLPEFVMSKQVHNLNHEGPSFSKCGRSTKCEAEAVQNYGIALTSFQIPIDSQGNACSYEKVVEHCEYSSQS